MVASILQFHWTRSILLSKQPSSLTHVLCVLTLNALWLLNLPMFQPTQSGEVLKRCLQGEEASLDMQGAHLRVLWITGTPQVLRDGDVVGADICARWLIGSFYPPCISPHIQYVSAPHHVSWPPTTRLGPHQHAPLSSHVRRPPLMHATLLPCTPPSSHVHHPLPMCTTLLPCAPPSHVCHPPPCTLAPTFASLS